MVLFIADGCVGIDFDSDGVDYYPSGKVVVFYYEQVNGDKSFKKVKRQWK